MIRDYSHRFTVDEHTFVAIENLHRLRQSQSKWDQRYAELLDELEQPDLLYLAHPAARHRQRPPEAITTRPPARQLQKSALSAWNLMPRRSRKRSRFLDFAPPGIELRALRRDIFDPDTVKQFAEKVGTPERLKNALSAHVCRH